MPYLHRGNQYLHLKAKGTDMPIATEVTANRRWSPIGTPQRHYRLDQHVTADDGERYRDVVIVDGFGITYAYAANPDGEVASWWTLTELDGNDSAVLDAIGFRIAKAA